MTSIFDIVNAPHYGPAAPFGGATFVFSIFSRESLPDKRPMFASIHGLNRFEQRSVRYVEKRTVVISFACGKQLAQESDVGWLHQVVIKFRLA
jgi:hypothetical protein